MLLSVWLLKKYKISSQLNVAIYKIKKMESIMIENSNVIKIKMTTSLLLRHVVSYIMYKTIKSWAENFRMGDIGINAWSSLFDNLKINIILQDYLKSVWKTIKFKLIFNHLRNCSSQSEKSGQPMREQKYSHWRKQLTDIQGERKRVD